MRRVLKSIVLSVLVFMIALPTSVMAYEIPTTEEMASNLQTGLVNKVDKDLQTYTDKEDGPVRIIVELQDKAIIEYATMQGVQVENLDEAYVASQTEALLSEQNQVITSMEESISSFEVHQQFTNVINGFSTTVNVDEIKDIAALKEVKAVYISNKYDRPEPQMVESDFYTHHKTANDYGYTGEGTVVAVIDTGVDPSHRDFVLDEGIDVALTEADVNEIISNIENPLSGQFYTEKVPYGYNYMDGNSEIRDLGAGASMHGMHVAGTVGANGNEEEGGIKGVAPNTQILALKVFGNDPEYPSTFGDIIIAAIDDAIVLGADVMNLSIGSTSSFVDETDPEQMAVERAVDNGIVMSISAGNSNVFGNGFNNPYAENPDIGVVGSPGLSTDSLQVASINNRTFLYETDVTAQGLEEAFQGYGADMWDANTTYDLVAIGGSKLGLPEDYEGIDVTGKVVLVSRGELSFYDKTQNAAAEGAIGIVVYDHGLSSFYKNQGGWDVPFMKVTKSVGLQLEEAIANSETKSIALNVSYGEFGKYVDPVAGLISDFSSFGTTPSLDFKPEIAAPGGNIYSTFNNNKYGVMSGTSMAAPHVAGGAALVMERVLEDPIFAFAQKGTRETAELVKNIMMNTAVPVMDENGYALTSPRGQGAGSMDLAAAMVTKSVVVNPETGIAKVNLGEVNVNTSRGNILEFELEVTNYGDVSSAYRPESSASVLYSNGDLNYLIPVDMFQVDKEESMDAEGPFFGSEYSSFYINGEEVNEIFEVQAGESVTLQVKIVIEAGDIAWANAVNPNGYFLEGFVTLVSGDELFDIVNASNAAIASKETEVTVKFSELENQRLKVSEAEEILATAEAIIKGEGGLNDQLAELQEAYDLVSEENKMILEQKEYINALQEMYDKQAYKLAVLIGDKADVAEIDQYIGLYTEQLAALELLIPELETQIALLEEATKLLNPVTDFDQIIINTGRLIMAKNLLEMLPIEINNLKELIDGLALSREDVDLFKAVYDKVQAELEAAANVLEEAKAELEVLRSAFSEDDLLVMKSYLQLQMMIEKAEADLVPLEENVDAEKALVTNLEDELNILLSELAALNADKSASLSDSAIATPLSVPYISFVGNWADARGFDASVYGSAGARSFYEETYLINITEEVDDTIYFNVLGSLEEGYSGNNVAFSPNFDGYNDEVTSRFSLLRNMKDITFTILDSSNEVVVNLGSYPEMRKNYFDRGYGQSSYIFEDYTWDGTKNLKVVEDGQYFYRIQGVVPGTDVVQELVMPVKVDTVAPVINDIDYINGEKEITILAEDELSGIQTYALVDYYKLLEEDIYEVVASSWTADIDLSAIGNDPMVVIPAVIDFAGNESIVDYPFVINDGAVPDVILSVEPFSVLTEREFKVTGELFDALPVGISIESEGEIDNLIFSEGAKFEFDAKFISDGKKDFRIFVTDLAGNEVEFKRHFYIDSAAPVITEVDDRFYSKDKDIIQVAADQSEFVLDAIVTDNFPDLRVKINGSEVASVYEDYVSYQDRLAPSELVISETLALEVGENIFIIEATDTTGALSTAKVIVNREDTSVSSPETSTPNTTPNTTATTTPNTTPAAATANEEVDIEDEGVALASPLFKTSNYIRGYVDGSFKPDETISRAEISAIIERVLTLEVAKDSKFGDVAESHWALSSIAAMEKAELIKGYEGLFMPNANITKAQMATILSRIITMIDVDVELLDNPYTDISGHWAEENIIKAYSYGIEISPDATEFNADDELTRAEAVVMINQLLKVAVSEDITSTTYSDVDVKHWAYKDIESAAKK